MKVLLSVIALLFSTLLIAQREKNYILEINGDTISISLDEPVSLKAKNGQSYKVSLKQKEILSYHDERFSFQYPSIFNISTKKIDDETEQLLCMSAAGNGFLIQQYKDSDPNDIAPTMMTEITKESKDAGYKETLTAVERKLKSGRILKGRESKLVLDDETAIFSIFPVKDDKNGGFLILILITDPSDTKEMAALETFWKTLEPKN